jgi:PhzF family phenazine biosynthesis protein
MRRFTQVDVFATGPGTGNPVAVVHDAGDLSDEEMRSFARWTNLSETTYVLPPTTAEADYRVRIFTPAEELPFAGHPTLGSCHAWLEAGGTPHAEGIVVQECPVGLVRLRRDGGRLAFAAPPLVRAGAVEETVLAELTATLRIERSEVLDAAWVDNGPGWVALRLATPERVLELRPGATEQKIGVLAKYGAGHDCAIEVRAFFPVDGATREDPVTGSLNASLALWLLESGELSSPYVASQGAALGRSGRVHVERDTDGVVWVGGDTISLISGSVAL